MVTVWKKGSTKYVDFTGSVRVSSSRRLKSHEEREILSERGFWLASGPAPKGIRP